MTKKFKPIVWMAALGLAVLLCACNTKPDDMTSDASTLGHEQTMSFSMETNNLETDPESNQLLYKDIQVETARGTLLYPGEWGDRIAISCQENEEQCLVTFKAKTEEDPILLFRVVIDANEENAVGAITKDGLRSFVHLEMEELEQAGLSEKELDQLYAMQEDVNYLLENLE